MITVSLTQIQRNPTLISQARESLQIFDKRKKNIIGIYIPSEQTTKKEKTKATATQWVDNIAGTFAHYVSKTGPGKDINQLIEEAKLLQYQSKYDARKS